MLLHPVPIEAFLFSQTAAYAGRLGSMRPAQRAEIRRQRYHLWACLSQLGDEAFELSRWVF